MTESQVATPDRAEADTEFARLLREAELGRLDAADFRRCDELLPHVSPELKR